MTLAEYYMNARKNAKMPSELKIPATLEEAYQIQKKNNAAFGEVQAWKLGGTTSLTREVFKTQDTYYGAVAKSVVFLGGERLRLPSYITSPVGELEVCFQLSKAVETAVDLDGDIDHFIDYVMPSIELPWSVFPLPDAGLNALIADTCAAGALILGEKIEWIADYADEKLTGSCTLKAGNLVLAEGSIENIVDGPLEALRDFLKLAKKYKITLKAGQFVATGGCCPCVSLPCSQELIVSFEKLGQFKFEIAGLRP